jgi:hypothetical protein
MRERRFNILFAVWTIPSPSRKCRGLGAARLVSTPSRPTSRQAWLEIATDEEVSPTLGSSTSPVSQASTQVFKLLPNGRVAEYRNRFVTEVIRHGCDMAQQKVQPLMDCGMQTDDSSFGEHD